MTLNMKDSGPYTTFVKKIKKNKTDQRPKKIKDVPRFDRPREKMAKKGPEALSNLELVAAILGRGIKGKDVYEVAWEIVKLAEKGFDALSLDKLQSITGVGSAKACQIMAAVEFAARFLGRERVRIRTDRDVFYLVAEVAEKKKEYFVTLTVDGANNLIQKRVVTVGTANQSMVHPREIFVDAISDRAAGIIVVHNHPSGISTPSKEDYVITDRLIKVSKIVGIDILDHIIISKSGYYSFQRSGYFRKKGAEQQQR